MGYLPRYLGQGLWLHPKGSVVSFERGANRKSPLTCKRVCCTFCRVSGILCRDYGYEDYGYEDYVYEDYGYEDYGYEYYGYEYGE
jgi:hypothetical protein